jgi:methyl-accepting chemotaxis protein
MQSRLSHADRRRYYQIDDQCISILLENKTFLLSELAVSLERLYSYLRNFLSGSAQETLEHKTSALKEKHVQHWLLLLEGRLDQEYENSVMKIYTARSTYGLDPRWYIGGYNFLMTEIITAIGARLPHRGLPFSWPRRKTELQSAFLRIASYDMAYTIEAYIEETKTDRIATMDQLARSFEDVVGGIVGTVASAAVQLRATADGLTHSAEATNLKSMAAAAASQDASSNVQVAAGVANHLSQAIGEISRRVHKSNRIAGKAADEADRTHAEVRNLSEATERIDGIIDLISNIAEQTNMLALNAAIEAARAGEAGRGFAVVAQEVKNLAEATAKATAEIGAQVVGIQTTTQNVASFIATIAETTREVSSIAVSVETAIAEQEIETREIACRVEEAARGTAEVASNIAGVTQAAGQSSSAARKLLESATNLTQQSEVLANHVEDFLKRVRTA